MKPKNLLPVLLLLFTCLSVQAQLTKIDSLRKLLTNEKDEKRKTDLLLMLSIEFRQINPDSSRILSDKVLKHSDKENNEELRMKAELNSVYYFINRSNPDSGLVITEKNINALKRKGRNDSLMAQYQSASGYTLMELNRQKEALEHFYTALKIADIIGDQKAKARALHQIGWAYMELNQSQKAIQYFKNSLQVFIDHQMAFLYPSTFTNLASCYGAIGKFDSAHYYGKQGVELAHKQNNYPVEANGWFILGTAYMEQKNYEEALKCFLKGKPIREKTGDYFFIVSDMAVIAELYALMGKTDEGIKISNEAMQIAEGQKLTAKFPMIYKSMALNYEMAGDFSAAASIYKKMNQLKDSIYTNASSEALAEMQTKYETEKKERTIQEQEFNLKKKNYLIATISGLLVLGLLLAYFIHTRNKLKQKAAMTEALFKQEQKATEAVIKAEEKERQRIAKDLHDGVGQMMSAAKMNLSAIVNELNFKNHEQQISFERILNLVDDSCREVRSVSHQMMPNLLLKSGLGKAVADFIDKIDRKVLKVNLHTEGLNERLDENTEIVLYRVLQESVNNVIKHSGATHLDLSILKDQEGISATIEDNGKGFSIAGLSEDSGMGLKNMKARVEYVKGSIEFHSSPGNGTLVAIHIPLTNNTSVNS
jgi:two-component system, NarL family, sensor kinase